MASASGLAAFLADGGSARSKIYGYLVPTETSGPREILPVVALINQSQFRLILAKVGGRKSLIVEPNVA